jgi:hypothetical protein
MPDQPSLTPEQFGALFTSFRSSAFRLEQLQVYNVPSEVEALAAWRKDGSVGPNEAWCRTIRAARSRGASMRRVRLVVEPLSDYTRWELAVMRWSVEAGEDIRVLVAGGLGEWPSGPDYWLFDDEIGVLMAYDDAGRFGGGRRSDDLAPLRDLRDQVWAAATPLADYLATVPAGAEGDRGPA